jgi:prepilin-type N-terminal cleavage/methylation domain-containing protein
MTDTTINQLKPENKAGFTLIELSIVLVIIGLLVGGILVGQDLIKASEIRATVGQYEKYNTAINTFRTKYNGIPGDLLGSSSTAFGLDPSGVAHGTSTANLGDGNGLINGVSADGNQSGEALYFWQQLSAANLIDGSYGTSVLATGLTSADMTSATVSSYFPAAKMGKGNYWMVGNDSAGMNQYVLGGITSATSSTAGVGTFAKTLTPVDAFNIDTKLDDGMPNTGVVQARATTTPFAALSTADAATSHATPASGDCLTGSDTASLTTNTYSRGSTAGTSLGCTLRLRFN